ncbi:MAG: hypothetical protein GC149_03240 [Gammaproteobacteria bacterium]|nr:hypothetical protein [Gammaproteobacteria bacterium]
MKTCMLALLLLLESSMALARGMTTREAECLSQIKDETDFVISRINLIHRDFEKQVKQSAIGDFKSGDYSTVGLLDNTIRKYHRKLVHRFKNYPFRYRAKINSSKSGRSRACLAEELRTESVGAIHDFELTWQETLRKAEKNVIYFQQLDELR